MLVRCFLKIYLRLIEASKCSSWSALVSISEMGSSELEIGRPGKIHRFEGDTGETTMSKSGSDKELVHDAFLSHLESVQSIAESIVSPSLKNRK